MDAGERRRFFRRYAPGLVPLGVVYLLITILRSVRGDFAPAIWLGLGVVGEPDVFAESEVVVALAVMLLNGSAVLVRDNRRAFFTAMALAVAGPVLIGAALLGLQAGRLAAFPFMVLTGLGLYLPYVAVHTTLFERLIAMTRDRGNIGYLMYLADAFGYLGYVVVLIAKNMLARGGSFLDFFLGLCWVIAGASLLMLVPCWRFFASLPAAKDLPLPKD
jgi:hypothetical protein